MRQTASFNSRSPNGLRHLGIAHLIGLRVVSIHAAQMGCDLATYRLLAGALVSIHAAQMGCDLQDSVGAEQAISFNSRSPNGLRRIL